MADKTTIPGAPAFDLKTMLGDGLKLPGLPDAETLLAAHKRNLEALAEANRVAREGAQAVARRHMEILQATMSSLTNNMKELSAISPASRAAKQAELLRRTYEEAVANTRELRDIIQKSNNEALDKLNLRVSEAITEMQKLLSK